MSKRQVIILWVISLVLLGTIAAVKLNQQPAATNATNRVRGQKLFESFPAKEIATIEIQGANSDVTLTKKSGRWVVAQSDDYPANPTFVNDLIRTLSDLKVTAGMKAGPSFAARFGMDETSKNSSEHGITTVFKNSTQQEIARVSFGKSIQSKSAEGSNAVGRYVRNHADDSGFYPVTEMFSALSANTKRWLKMDFISPEKISRVSVSKPDSSETAWQLTRDSEDANFKLTDATPVEILNQTTAAPLKNLLSFARFEDVIPKNLIAEKSAATGHHTAVIETFEGFTYNLTVVPTKPTSTPPVITDEDETPPATDNYLLTVRINAEIPKERKKDPSEKPEDTAAKDAAFVERAKSLTTKLANEKNYENHTYEVAKTLIAALLDSRQKLLTSTAPAATSSAQKFPGGLISNPSENGTPQADPAAVPSK